MNRPPEAIGGPYDGADVRHWWPHGVVAAECPSGRWAVYERKGGDYRFVRMCVREEVELSEAEGKADA